MWDPVLKLPSSSPMVGNGKKAAQHTRDVGGAPDEPITGVLASLNEVDRLVQNVPFSLKLCFHSLCNVII